MIGARAAGPLVRGQLARARAGRLHSDPRIRLLTQWRLSFAASE
jgi:hypothetical protein